MERRSLLASVGIGFGTCLTGCLARVGNPDNGESDGHTPTDAGTHHFYLENLDDRSRRIDLEIVAPEADEPLIQGTFEIPAERGGEFREIGAWDRTYGVTATPEGGRMETFTWDVEGCPGPTAQDESELQDGSRNASVRIHPGADDLSFVTDSCDEIVAGTEVPTGPARQFEVDENPGECPATSPPQPETGAGLPDPRSYPEGPPELTGDAVRAFVEAYERTYGYNALLADFAAGGNCVKYLELYVVEEETTIVETDQGFEAHVTTSGSYTGEACPGETGTDTSSPLPHVDLGGSTARYRVTSETLEREGTVHECW